MKPLVSVRPAPPSRPVAHRVLEPVRQPGAHPLLPLTETDPQPIPQLDPALHRLARGITAAVVETLAGRRSLHQLAAWLDNRTRDRLDQLCHSLSAPGLRLRSVRVQQPHDRAVEVAAVLALDGRCCAAALRLDLKAGRWRVSSVELALHPSRARRAA